MPMPPQAADPTYSAAIPVGNGARLDALLHELMRRVPELEAAAVVTADGLPMASALPPGMDEDRVAAMSAALLSLGERAAEGLGRGGLSQVHIQGESGGVWLMAAGDDAVLVGVSAADAKAGLVLYELRRATTAVGIALAADELAELAERTELAAEQAAQQAALQAAQQAAHEAAERAQAAPAAPVDRLPQPSSVPPASGVSAASWPSAGSVGWS